MDQQPVVHNTFVVERNFPVKPERVFTAFADPAQKRRWYLDGERSQVEGYDLDFSVGGKEYYLLGFKEGHPLAGRSLKNENVYRDIVPNRRVIFTSTMAMADKCISVSLGTIELLPAGEGTNLILTFQSAFLEGADGPQMREAGWRSLFDRLANTLVN
jgi:uncharacterized protein YndB with AHSA1/START domain